MKTIVINSRMYGTNAERLAMNLSASDTEIDFYETDTNNEYKWKGSEWIRTGANGAGFVTQATLTSGEDQTNNVIRVERQNESYSAARSTADTTIGVVGAIGDLLDRVILTAAVTTATLEVKDKSGTVLAAFLTTDAVGTVREVGAVAVGAGFAITSHATGAGTVTAIGRFS